MRTSILVALVLSASLAAQTAPKFTTPPGYATKVSTAFANPQPLAFFEGRTQVIERNMPQGKKLLLTRLEYRTSSLITYRSYDYRGTVYSNVSITFGDAVASPWSTFSTNFRTAGTVVFNAKMTTPDLTLGKVTPVWGNIASIPLKAYTYSAKYDLLMDWTVRGGKLSNGMTGATGAPRTTDGFWDTGALAISPQSNGVSGSKFLPGPPVLSGGCTDSRQSGISADAYASGWASVYSLNHSTPSLRGKMVIHTLLGYFGRPSGTHIGILSLGGNDSGVNLSAKCHKLYINPSTALIVSPVKADSKGHSGHIKRTTVTYNPAWKGLAVYWQYGFEDSKTRQLVLSRAVKLVLPRLPGFAGVKQNTVVFRYWYNGSWSSTSANFGRMIHGYGSTATKGWNRK